MSGYEILSLVFQVMTLIFASVKTTAACMIHFDSTKIG